MPAFEYEHPRWTAVRRVQYTDPRMSSVAYLYESRAEPGTFAVSEYCPAAQHDLPSRVWDASFRVVTAHELRQGIAATHTGRTVQLNTPAAIAPLSSQELHAWESSSLT